MPRRNRASTALLLTLIAMAGCGGGPQPARSACATASACVEAAETRSELDLDGAWLGVRVRERQDQPPTDGWQEFTVPGVVWSEPAGGSEYLWLRRTITIPAEWTGQRVFVRLGGARYSPHVFVDGKLAGSRLDGWSTFEVELTDHVKRPGTHELVVRCQDRGATFADGVTLPDPIAGDARSQPQGKIIAPIGGHIGVYGPWDEVALVVRPRTHASELVISTSHRQESMAVEGIIADKAPVRVEAFVLDGANVVLSLPAMTPGSDGRFRLEAKFPAAKRWSPESPHLYKLRLVVSHKEQDTPLDVSDHVFGFKELWAEGPDLYLNGAKRMLLATSTWPSATPQTRDEIRESLQKIKESNAIAFRLHTQPWQKMWLEEADRIGLLIVEEGALWCDSGGGYAYDDPRFWTNVKEHLANMVRRDRNHASLGIWSIENEILHCGAGRYSKHVEKNLADVGRFLKELDPHHLITFEADHDPGGVADIIGLHYPHEAPDHHDYPNTADWLGNTVVTGTAGGLMGSRAASFSWDRKKPLYIGEYLWCPQNDYSLGTVFYGPEAYRNREQYHALGQAKAWIDQTLAYRRARVSAMCPWTAIQGGGKPAAILYDTQKSVYANVAAFIREQDTRVFAGERLQRTVDVFNDGPSPLDLVLDYALSGTALKGTLEVPLLAGEYRALELSLAVPTPIQKSEHAIKLVLRAGDQVMHTHEQAISVWPKSRITTPQGTQVIVFDPKGSWFDSMKQRGLEAARLDTLAGIAGKPPLEQLLVIAPHALSGRAPQGESLPTVRRPDPSLGSLTRFVDGGGRVLLLEQTSYGNVPLGLDVVEFAATRAFAIDVGHPLFRGLEQADLSLWRGDHYVTRQQIARPVGGGRAHVVSGGVSELDQASVVELSFGKGRLLAMQALVGEKLDTEPAARVLFQNALGYLAEPRVEQRTLVVSDDPAFDRALTRLGVIHEKLAQPLAPGFARPADVLLLAGGGPRVTGSLPAIRAYLAASRGGAMYWYSPGRVAFDALRSDLGASMLDLVPGHGPLVAAERPSAPFAAVCTEDLVWKGEPSGESWMRGFAPDPKVATQLFGVNASGIQQQPVAIEEVSGTYVARQPDGSVLFATNGTARASARIGESGLRPITLVLSGTTYKNVLPTAHVTVGGKLVGQVSLTQKEQRAYTVLAPLTAGTHAVEVSFVNDDSGQGEDRNMVLHSIALAEKPWEALEAELLTYPPAAIRVAPTRQRELPVIIDNIRWAHEERNRVRASRYGSALLSALGARFQVPTTAPSWIGAGSFRLVGESPFSSLTPHEVRLFAPGTIEAEFEVGDPGDYEVVLRGRSDPAAGVYAEAELSLDGKRLGSVFLAARQTSEFGGPSVRLAKGRHRVTVRFANDATINGEDRNMFLASLGFRAR